MSFRELIDAYWNCKRMQAEVLASHALFLINTRVNAPCKLTLED